MIRNRQRRLGQIAAALLATATLTLTTSPALVAATGSPDGADEVCWLAAETGVIQCYDDEAEMAESILDQTGARIVEEGASTSARSSSALAAASLYPISRMFEDPDYEGSYLTVTAPSTTFCVNSSVQLSNMGAWSDRVSSVLSYNGCLTRLWPNINFGGTYATFNDAATLGSMGNASSSYKVY